MSLRRAASLPVFAVALVLCIALACSRDPEPPSVATPSVGPSTPAELARDDRIAYLLPPCTHPEPFLADTSDMVAVLVSKLGRGQLDPLKQAKTELAHMGPEVVPELRRFFERAYVNALSAPLVLNALAVAEAMDSDDGREILLDGLQHPQESVRLAAVHGLRRHSRPEDYDRLIALLPMAGPELARAIGQTLIVVDRERLEADLLEWFAAGRQANLWSDLFPLIADTQRPATLAKMAELAPRAEGTPALTMQAALARSGDVEARAHVGRWLEDENPQRRLVAARVLDRAGLTLEIAPLVAKDPDPTVRQFVAQALSQIAATPEVQAHLRVASGDAVRGVRMSSLAILVAQGDAAATNEILELLRGDKGDLEAALSILRASWDKHPGLAERALSILMRLRAGELQPVRVDRLALDQALGQVPLLAAAQELYRCALETDGEIQGLRAHRWYLQQVGNVGPIGRDLAREHWDGESSPERRMDLVMASSFDQSDAARALLVRVIDSGRSTPDEILYAANRLVRIGPTRTTAPYLKRAILRVTDPLVRPALNCLLWEWYGLDV